MSGVEPQVRVQADDFDVAAETARITAGRHDIGAVVTFTGLCRDEAGTLAALELEHYPGMAEAEILRICQQAVRRWPLQGLTAVHRHGKIAPGENIVLVIAASPHRQAAFEAANFVMDFLKTGAPFWKKEHFVAGGEGGWVSAKDADDAARRRWEDASAKPSENQYVLDPKPNSVRLWSMKKMPLSPEDEMHAARQKMRESLQEMRPAPGLILHCVHTSHDRGKADVENTLIYNIGPWVFNNAAQNGIRFAFQKNAPCTTLDGVHYPYLSEYYFDKLPEFPCTILGEIKFHLSSTNSVFDIWWQCSKVKANFRKPIEGTFGLIIKYGKAHHTSSVASTLKMLVDGIVASFHTDAKPDEIAVERLSNKHNVPGDAIRDRLMDQSQSRLLGTASKPLVRQYRDFVQWFPEDHDLVECVFLPSKTDFDVCHVQIYEKPL